MKETKVKGYITFYVSEDEIKYDICDIDARQKKLDVDKIYNSDKIKGETFADEIESGQIVDDDGVLCSILINGYISNLGIQADNFSQGEFLVDITTFRKICKAFNVEVDWTNR